MKRLIIIGALTAGSVAHGQDLTLPPPAMPQAGRMINPHREIAKDEVELPRFNLDFPGGNPELLVFYINEKVRGTSPLNAIIPEEFMDMRIPPMKLQNVSVVQVFDALSNASRKRVQYKIDNNRYSEREESYSFQANHPITTNSIWYFYAPRTQQPLEEKICRFYQLAPYLERGLDVNDITTAIKAGYKMLGDTNAPELNFHKETKLLIAVAPPSKLMLIDQALKELSRTPAAPQPFGVPMIDAPK